MRLLIAEHDWALGAFLARGLEQDGHEVSSVVDGVLALDALRENAPELAIVDVDTPDGDGVAVLRDLHARASDMPIVALTSRHDAARRVECLEAGAYEVVEKPLSLAELRVRCGRLLRRRAPGVVVHCGALEVNRVERCVRRRGETIWLSNREYALLDFLLQRRGEAVSRKTLLARVWNRTVGVQTNVVDVYVNYLRRKLRDSTGATVIETVRGKGYCIPAEA